MNFDMISRPVARLPLPALANMAMLYIGKTSNIFVAVLFLPLYSRILGAEQFGMVAVLLSLQALLMMMDLGLIVLVSRDVASDDSRPRQLLRLIRVAEATLTGLYIIILILATFFKVIGIPSNVGIYDVLGSVLLFWTLVLQNLHYSAMLARRSYRTASVIQILGVGARAVSTAFVLNAFSPTLTAFITTQLVLSVGHLLVMRHYSDRLFQVGSLIIETRQRISATDCINLLKLARPLAIFSFAGAVVMQLDKPIVSAFMSVQNVAPYFLATTFCMVPISIMAGPTSQYFQPPLINAMSRQDVLLTRKILMRFVTVLIFVTVLPSAGIWIFRVQLIDLWLNENISNGIIANYVGVLLPGVTIGALGFIPYSLLIGAKDFKFQAKLSGALTIVTLIGAAVFAIIKSVEGICYIYAAYHTASTLLSWCRAIVLPETKTLGKYSAISAIKGFSIIIIVTALVKYIIEKLV